LINQLKVAEAAKDRDLQERIQTLINNTAIDIERLRQGLPPIIDDEGGGGGGGGSGGGGVGSLESYQNLGPTDIFEIPPGASYPYTIPGTTIVVGSGPGGRLTDAESDTVNQDVLDMIS
jgi:hypothetical protein